MTFIALTVGFSLNLSSGEVKAGNEKGDRNKIQNKSEEKEIDIDELIKKQLKKWKTEKKKEKEKACKETGPQIMDSEGINSEILDKYTKTDSESNPEINPKENPQEPENPATIIPEGMEQDVLYFDLASYLIVATGEKITPEITNVFTYEVKDETLVKTVLEEKEYTVKYFKVLSEKKTDEEVLQPISQIVLPGEYKIVLNRKGDSDNRHGGSRLITVLGKPQRIISKFTRIQISPFTKEFMLELETDGDGKSFEYKVIGDSVKVDEKGKVTVVKPGDSVIIAMTVGDKISHPAKLKIFVQVVDMDYETMPEKVPKEDKRGKATK